MKIYLLFSICIRGIDVPGSLLLHHFSLLLPKGLMIAQWCADEERGMQVKWVDGKPSLLTTTFTMS